MPMQQNPNNRRRGEERNETLIIPHITKEMVETARRMAERGASRAEIERAIAAMQAGKSAAEAEHDAAAGQTAPAAPKPSIVQQQKPAAPQRNTAAHSDTVIIPTSRPRYTAAERRAMLEEVQRRQAEREAARRAEAQEEESHFRTYRDREYGANPAPKPPAPKPASPAVTAARPADSTRTVMLPRDELRTAAKKPAAAPAPQPAPGTQPAPHPAQTQTIQQPAAAPKPTPKPAAPTAAKPKPTGAPRNYAEAEAQLNERIRADHIWLSNPVLVRGLGLAPVIGAALDGQRALMLCIAALILVTFTRVLAVAVCHLTKNRFRPVIYCYSAALLYIPTYVLLYRLFGTDLSLLGIYLPIFVVEPAIVKRMEFSELEPVRDAFRHGFNNALGMCVVLLLVGCLRELLATGAVFGNVILHNALLPMAALPAGGFVIFGILAAVWCAAANLYTDYKHEEVRRLYADRKH